MKTKLFSLLLLLLCLGSSGAWSQSAISITWPMIDNVNATSQAGSANVANVVTVNNATLSTAYTSLAWADSKNLSYSDGAAGANGNDKFYAGGVTVTNNPNTDSDNASVNEDCYLKFTFTIAGDKTFTPTGFSFDCGRSGTDAGCVQGALILSDGSTKSTSTIVRPTRTDKKNVYDSHVSKTVSGANAYAAGATVTFYIYIGGKCGGKTLYFRDVTITGTYASSSMTTLTAPSISVNQLTGQVTFNNIDDNATKVTYTTDGTDPTVSSTPYSDPFTIDENCTIKAIAIGDGENFANSSIASQEAVITVSDPIITAHNGTVGITCATDGATIKYNFDNGESWNTYSLPFTLFTGQTVYAKAEHASYKNNSSTVNQSVAAAPAAKTGSQTKILGFVTPGENNWEYMSGDNGSGGTTNYGIQGKADTAEEGWSLWISPNGSSQYDKGISGDGSVNSTYTISGNSYQYIKNSNSRQFNIGMPSNLRANRLTIYSWNNGDGTTIWSPVGGNTFTSDTEVPIVSQSGATPEIRVFALDDVANNIALNNAGVQQCFIVAVDYTVYVPGPADAENITKSTNITETVTFNKSSSSVNNAVSPNTVASIVAIASPSLKTTSLEGYAGALELGSSTTITISLPESATNASVTLVDEASTDKKLKVDGTDDTSRTWIGNATDGYSTTINIPDAKAGSNFVIAKKDTGTKIVKITLTYTADVPTGNITLTTTDNMAGWRAFYDASQGYTVDSNTKVYVATSKTDETVTLTPISGIPSGTPVILKTSADNHKMTLTKATVAAYEGDANLLIYTTSEVSKKYRLGYKSGEGNGVGFYPYSGTPTSGAVILNVSSEARALTIVLEDEETTGISAALNDKGQTTNDKVVYDLQGRRVAQPTKGLYIVNGRKVVIK